MYRIRGMLVAQVALCYLFGIKKTSTVSSSESKQNEVTLDSNSQHYKLVRCRLSGSAKLSKTRIG